MYLRYFFDIAFFQLYTVLVFNYHAVTASCGIFGFITGAQKSRGIVLVEITELFPEAPAIFLIWILNINFLMDRGLGMFYLCVDVTFIFSYQPSEN